MAPTKSVSRSSNKASQEASAEIVPKQLAERLSEPPKLFILPNDAVSEAARFVSLADPATGHLNKYIYCPQSGFYELTEIPPSTSDPSSCLIVGAFDNDQHVTSGHVSQSSAVFVATAIDPIFFAAHLAAPVMGMDERGRPIRPSTRDELLEQLGSTSKHMRDLLRRPDAQKLLFDRIAKISKEGEEWTAPTFLPQSTDLLGELLEKAGAMAEPGTWPESMEQQVQRQLAVPMITNEQTEGITNAPAQGDALVKLTEKLRKRVALQFIMAMYLTPKMRKYLQSILDSDVYAEDNADLDQHLAYVSKKRTEAQALRSLSDNISRKRANEDDDEANEMREAKRKRKEEEEKKRKAESRATKDLRKVDVSGMKKLSSFFTKK